MNKQRITWIKSDDLDSIIKSCEKDKSGNYLVPDTLEIYVVPTKEEQIKMEITRLEKWFENNKETTKEQLIETGKVHDEYFMNKNILEYYKSQL